MNSELNDNQHFSNAEQQVENGLARLKSSVSFDTSALEKTIVEAAPAAKTSLLCDDESHESVVSWTPRLAVPLMICTVLLGVYMLNFSTSIGINEAELAIAEIEFEELWLMEEQLSLNDQSLFFE